MYWVSSGFVQVEAMVVTASGRKWLFVLLEQYFALKFRCE